MTTQERAHLKQEQCSYAGLTITYMICNSLWFFKNCGFSNMNMLLIREYTCLLFDLGPTTATYK